MGHTHFKYLKDLKGELDVVRNLNGIKEKNPGIFYLKSIPFLHFHDADGTRWADVKSETGKGWTRLEIPFEPGPKDRKKLISHVLLAYRALSGSPPPKL